MLITSSRAVGCRRWSNHVPLGNNFVSCRQCCTSRLSVFILLVFVIVTFRKTLPCWTGRWRQYLLYSTWRYHTWRCRQNSCQRSSHTRTAIGIKTQGSACFVDYSYYPVISCVPLHFNLFLPSLYIVRYSISINSCIDTAAVRKNDQHLPIIV